MEVENALSDDAPQLAPTTENQEASFQRKYDFWPSFYQNTLFSKEVRFLSAVQLYIISDESQICYKSTNKLFQFVELPRSALFHNRMLWKRAMAILKREFCLLISVNSVEMTALSRGNSMTPYMSMSVHYPCSAGWNL